MLISVLLACGCILVGGLGVLQSGVNYQLSLALGGKSLYAVFVSMSVALLTILWPTMKTVKVEKWVLLYNEMKDNPRLSITMTSGLLGAYFVFGTIVLTPVIGFGLFFTSAIFGELFTSLLIDWCGFFWIKPRLVGNGRIAGVLLVFVGVLIFQWENFVVDENLDILVATASVAASILSGISLIVQSSFNQRVAMVLGNSLGATMLSIIVAMFLTLMICIHDLIKHGLEVQSRNEWDHLYLYTGGIIGCLVLWVVTDVPAKIGMTMTFISIVVGQLIGALVFDALGLFGVAVRSITEKRLYGLALAVSGVILANFNTGQENSASAKQNTTLKLISREIVQKETQESLNIETVISDVTQLIETDCNSVEEKMQNGIVLRELDTITTIV